MRKPTKVEEPKAEILFAVSYLKNSEVEKEIFFIENITELEPDSERAGLSLVLLKRPPPPLPPKNIQEISIRNW